MTSFDVVRAPPAILSYKPPSAAADATPPLSPSLLPPSSLSLHSTPLSSFSPPSAFTLRFPLIISGYQLAPPSQPPSARRLHTHSLPTSYRKTSSWIRGQLGRDQLGVGICALMDWKGAFLPYGREFLMLITLVAVQLLLQCAPQNGLAYPRHVILLLIPSSYCTTYPSSRCCARGLI